VEGCNLLSLALLLLLVSWIMPFGLAFLAPFWPSFLLFLSGQEACFIDETRRGRDKEEDESELQWGDDENK
jgi:hypothetical protein